MTVVGGALVVHSILVNRRLDELFHCLGVKPGEGERDPTGSHQPLVLGLSGRDLAQVGCHESVEPADKVFRLMDVFAQVFVV